MAGRCICGHGYGVHWKAGPLTVQDGVAEFAPSHDEARSLCTGYPDKMRRDGRRCECRQFQRVEEER